MNVLLSSLKYRCVASKVTIQLLYVEIEPGYLAFGDVTRCEYYGHDHDILGKKKEYSEWK